MRPIVHGTGCSALNAGKSAAKPQHACEVAGRQLTSAGWDAALPGRDYDPAC
jgi:hypothetical protein